MNIDGYSYSAEVTGERGYGPDQVILHRDDNLIASTRWADEGFIVARFLDERPYANLVAGVTTILRDLIASHLEHGVEEFSLDRYHRYVTPDVHKAVIRQTVSGLPIERLPIPVFLIERRVSELCGVSVSAHSGHLKSPLFYLRLVRPEAYTDSNPPHRDVWLPHLRNCVNIYVPLAGSNERSALPMIPGSHLWKESEIERTHQGALVAGQHYRVPSVTAAARPLVMVRPNPGANEFTLFSPYLIHGGGVNLNADTTRVSLEMRFWRAS